MQPMQGRNLQVSFQSPSLEAEMCQRSSIRCVRHLPVIYLYRELFARNDQRPTDSQARRGGLDALGSEEDTYACSHDYILPPYPT